ncbi:hypothetical protein P7K49_023038 [Saguinus oedipus]|uniref:Basic proline-rich protein-like n=1 Tax=Saguinus oedipus TaxID=9490 RepID=A0ABQ9UKH2_SAGOE|nr:hypothetical protein P7K49_023038 [Saguinus oedipus]
MTTTSRGPTQIQGADGVLCQPGSEPPPWERREGSQATRDLARPRPVSEELGRGGGARAVRGSSEACGQTAASREARAKTRDRGRLGLRNRRAGDCGGRRRVEQELERGLGVGSGSGLGTPSGGPRADLAAGEKSTGLCPRRVWRHLGQRRVCQGASQEDLEAESGTQGSRAKAGSPSPKGASEKWPEGAGRSQSPSRDWCCDRCKQEGREPRRRVPKRGGRGAGAVPPTPPRKEKPKVELGAGPAGGGASRLRWTRLRAGLKDKRRGGRRADRAAAVAAARLQAPEHAREQRRSPPEPPAAPPAAPRAPPPGEPVPGRGGVREEGGESRAAGSLAGLRGCRMGSRPPRPWPPAAPPGPPPARESPAAQPFSGASPNRPDRAPIPAWPAGGERRAASGALTAVAGAGCSPRPPLGCAQRPDSASTEPPPARKSSAECRARFLAVPTEAERSRADLVRWERRPPELQRGRSPARLRSAPAHRLLSPRSAPPDAMAHPSGWPLL